MVKRSSSDFVRCVTRDEQRKKYVKFPFLGFFACEEVFAFLLGGELILDPSAFLFLPFQPAPDCACCDF